MNKITLKKKFTETDNEIAFYWNTIKNRLVLWLYFEYIIALSNGVLKAQGSHLNYKKIWHLWYYCLVKF